METITHSNGKEVVVASFNNLREKLAVSTGYVRSMNAFSRMMTEKDGIIRPVMDEEAGHASIIKAHNKFYGLTSKYDGKGNLRT